MSEARRPRTLSRSLPCAVLVATLAAASAAAQAPTAPLFPHPFVVEHHLVQVDADGTTFVGDPVTDTYTGSWIVSQRVDGGKTIVDLGRREVIDVQPGRGSYTVLSFDRLAELRRRLLRAERGEVADPKAGGADEAGVEAGGEPTIDIEELPVPRAQSVDPGDPLARPGVRHLRVTVRRADVTAAAGSLEVWADPRIRLGARARAVLAELETRVLGDGGGGVASLLAAAREHAGGAFPVRTLRAASPRAGGTIDDRVTRLELLDAVPADLLTVPEGLKRVAHPLEVMVAWAEREAELAAGRPGGGER